MKKVLIVITTAFVRVGGLTSVMMNYYRALDKSDLQIDFASTNVIEIDLQDEISQYNSKYYQLPKRSNPLKYIRTLSKISKGYDVLHVHGNSATTTLELLAGKMAKIPKRIVHIHTSNPEHHILHSLFKPFFNNLYTDALACSDVAGNWIFGENNFTVLKNAIDVNKYVYNELVRREYREKLGIENNFVFGHVGKMMSAKNHIFLIDVFKELLKQNNNIKLLLIGDGELREMVEKEIIAKGVTDDTFLLGMRQDIPNLLQAMDVFLFPSFWEGLPLSVLEAQSAGLPCFISSSVTKEVKVTEYARYLSLALSAKEWADYIIQNMPRQDRSEICKDVFEAMKEKKYEISSVADDLHAIYKQN